ncbi:LpqB family beta-propeller domain-containing protein [Nocardioides pantholopis]|uniref:LpqB family beta-propeller domain-containing protein n=1 Tax=Nocardioides pantholopis TaxID=2483798 RepID=UPI000FD7E0BC|nr:LpqB family beta-propeller domain-containing protein [Nocardioides pantholopis]
MRRARVGIAVLLVALLGSGCVGMPGEGPVVETAGGGGESVVRGYNYDPLPPQPDARPAEIVRGFLDAMMASPVQANSARQFLTKDAQAGWDPERRTLTYVERGTTVGDSPVTVDLPGGGDVFDARGAWQGSLPEGQRRLSFDLAVENGEWRISSAPDAMIVSEQFFEQRFRRAALYFFDPTAQILVPEPVYVPSGGQLATSLVNGLLVGPDPALDRATRTFLPAGLSAGLSVPVSEDGVAEIDLGGEAARPTPESVRYIVAQLAWTLRQVPGIERFRLAVGDVPVRLPNGDSVFSVDAGADFDPTGPRPSDSLFGVRAGRLVSGVPEALDDVGGPLGAESADLSRVAVDLDAELAAGVSADGTSARVAPVTADRTGEVPVAEAVSGATDLLDPAWDFSGRLWLLDRRDGDARVLYREEGRTRTLRVPGITGASVRSVLVSRDGSRLVAVVRRGRFDVLLGSRLLYDSVGRVLRAAPATRLVLDPGVSHQIRDIAWLNPTTVAALTRVGGQLWEVRTVSVDGAPMSQDSVATLRGPVRGLVGSPVAGQGLLVVTGAQALDLSGSAVRPVALDPDVTDLDYAG